MVAVSDTTEGKKSTDILVKTFIAGGTAGCCAKTTVAPLDRVKILMQGHNKHYKHLGVISSLRGVTEKEGFLGLYKGNFAQMIRIFPYAAIQFMSFEQYKKSLQSMTHHVHPHVVNLLSGSLAGLTAVFATYPLDVVRARLAFQVTGEHIYFGVIDTFRTIKIEEGRKGFFRGIIPSLLGMAPYAVSENLDIYGIMQGKGTLPGTFYIQADNCFRENKNKYVLAFCELLIRMKIFAEVHLSFLYVGHTHEDIDAQFSHLAGILKTNDAVTLPRLLALFPNAVQLRGLYNFKEWVEPYLNEIQHHSKPLHFLFRKARDEDVEVCYKGQNNAAWLLLPTSILTGIPEGRPAILKPESMHKIDSKLLQKTIEKCCHLFQEPSSKTWWTGYINGLSFYTFETLKAFCLSTFPDQLGRPCPKNTGGLVLFTPAKLICGGLAGAVAQSLVYPLDVARRKIQLASMLPEPHKYNGKRWWTILHVVYQDHGIRNGLFRGLTINYIRVMPMTAMSFTVYETTKQMFGLDTGVTR